MGLHGVRLNVRRLTLLGAFLGALMVVAGVGIRWGGWASLIVGGVALTALCVGLDFEPERE